MMEDTTKLRNKAIIIDHDFDVVTDKQDDKEVVKDTTVSTKGSVGTFGFMSSDQNSDQN